MKVFVVLGLLITGYVAISIAERKDIDMAAVYVALIVKGKKEFKDIPKSIKEQVKEMLIDLELEFLAEE